MISRHISVPTSSARRVAPAGKAASSGDQPKPQNQALVLVPTPRTEPSKKKSVYRARNAASEVVVQIIAGPQRRGLKAENSELARYRRAYAQASQSQAPAPRMERRA